MIQARELVLDSRTTVTDIYKLVDMPYKITNKSKVFVRRIDPQYNQLVDRYQEQPIVLRVEWEMDEKDPLL